MATKAAKEQALKSFRSITNATQADATRLLKNNNYRVENAVDDFYSDPIAMANAAKAGGGAAADKKKLKEAQDKLGALFDEYKDEDSGDMEIEGVQEYFSHLSLGLEDVVVLPLCYYLKAPAMGKFTRQDFIHGWSVLLDRSDTIEKQKATIEKIRTEFEHNDPVRKDPAEAAAAIAAAMDSYGYSSAGSSNSTPITPPAGLYNKTYEFTYSFGRQEGQKSLDLDTALAFWELILPYAPGFAKDQPLAKASKKSTKAAAAEEDEDEDEGGTFTKGQLEMWKTYLRTKTNGRAVSKDTWMLFLDFIDEIDPEFQNHDEDGAWPSTIDDFVAWAQEEIEAGRGPDAMDES